MKRARLVDVAREAGVSVGAASDALAGKNRIPEATRERVREAATRLGYVPNAAARALGSGHLPIVGLVVGSLRRPEEFERFGAFWADVIGRASTVLAQRGYALAVLPELDGPAPTAIPFAAVVLMGVAPGDPGIDRVRAAGIPLLDLGDIDVGVRSGVPGGMEVTDQSVVPLPQMLAQIEALLDLLDRRAEPAG